MGSLFRECKNGWIVVVGRFISGFVEVGTVKSFGVLLPEIVTQLNATSGKIGLAFGLCHGLTFGLGKCLDQFDSFRENYKTRSQIVFRMINSRQFKCPTVYSIEIKFRLRLVRFQTHVFEFLGHGGPNFLQILIKPKATFSSIVLTSRITSAGYIMRMYSSCKHVCWYYIGIKVLNFKDNLLYHVCIIIMAIAILSSKSP